MKNRVIYSIILIVLMLSFVLASELTRILFFCASGILCAYELQKNLRNINITTTGWVLYLYLVVMAVLTIMHRGRTEYLAWFTVAVYIALLSGILHKNVSGQGAIYTLFALAYPCFPFAIIMIAGASDRWLQTLAIACISTWTCDTFALFGGKWWGKHKVAPDVSPNKTVEGCISGAASSLLAGFLIWACSLLFKPIGLVTCLATAFISSSFGQIGDLAESLIKRYIGIKDFSNLIPGHGGMFDRADSLMFSIPTAYFSLYFFQLIKMF